MGGNRKHGYMRGNRGGVKPSPWYCDACQRMHDGRRSRNGTLDGRSLCDRAYYREKRQAMMQPASSSQQLIKEVSDHD